MIALRAELNSPVPEDTAPIARAAFPQGNRDLVLRDTLGTIVADARFAARYPRRGRPAEAPWRLALVCVLQASAGLPDRQAAAAVQARIDWKYLLRLELSAPGLHCSVLQRCRDRLLAGATEAVVLDAVLELCTAHGYLPERGRQRTAATHVLGLLRTLSRLERVGETLRAALTALATVAPAWLQSHSDPAWAVRYGRRVEAYRLPTRQAARAAYAVQVGADGLLLLAAVAAPDAPVALLRQVWLQQVLVWAGVVRLRTPDELPPSAAQIVSPSAADARDAAKRAPHWTGDQVHLTETVTQPDVPRLITQVTTTVATTAAVTQIGPVQQALADAGLLAAEQVVDTGYISGHTLTASQTPQIELVGPLYADHQWQAQAGAGIALADVAVAWAAQVATCPQGQQRRVWSADTDARRGPLITVAFAAVACTACPVRDQCTRAAAGKPRQRTLRVPADQAAIAAARVRQQRPDFAARYAARAGIEGRRSQGVRAFGLRQARCRGLGKTHLRQLAGAAAINLSRVYAHLLGRPRATSRRSPLFHVIAAAA